jgi:hypothetical protein
MKPNNKDAYRLWWEFLKLSDDYREYCSLSPEKKLAREIPRGPEPKRKPAEKKDAILIDKKQKDSRIKKFKKGEFPKNFKPIYAIFGNVHQDLFDDFWEKKGKNLTSSEDYQAIQRLSQVFLVHCINYCECYSQRNPDFMEFWQYVLKHMTDDPYSLYLHIDITKPVGEIKKEFNKIINQKVNSKKVKNARRVERWLWRKNRIPTPNYNANRYDEIQRYLKVMQIYKMDGLRGKSAFSKFYPDIKYKDATTERYRFFADKKKGERIIKNVERGYFPGYYEENAPKWLK